MLDRLGGRRRGCASPGTHCQEILWRPGVAPDTYSLSEGHQLRFNAYHHRSAYEDDTLQAGADNDQCTYAGSRLHAFDLSPTRKTLSSVSDPSKNLMTAYRKNLPHRLDLVNPFPPDLSGYVHGFSY